MYSMTINGILNIHKPAGMTSFGVVSRLRRLTRQKHIGHTGTLDPMATGVLPVCFGQATRITSFIIDSDKTYLADIELGSSTDTYDREGNITERFDVSGLTTEQVSKALKSFTGTIEQVPPLFSAIKQDGKKLYKLARSGVIVKPRPRKVTINRIKILLINLPVISIEVDCSKGTYIRSLAHDLGQKLGCGAHLTKLARTRCGIFKIKDAVELSSVKEAFKSGNWEPLLYPLDYPLAAYKKATLNKEQETNIKNGLPVQLEINLTNKEDIICAYNQQGSFTAMLKYGSSTELWHPYKVFNTAFSD